MGNKLETTYYSHIGTRGTWGSGQTPGQPVLEFLRYKTVFKRSGGDNPNFRYFIKRGADATNPLVVEAQTVSYKPGLLEAKWISDALNRNGQVIKTNVFSNWLPDSHVRQPPLLFQQSVGNKALIGIIKKIRKNESGDLSGPTFVGELRETLSMIRSPFKSLRLKTGLFTDLQMRISRDKIAKKGKFKAEPWSKVLSDTWLEFVFGAKPLMSDIDAIIRAYLDQRDRYFRGSLKRLSYRFTDTDFSSSSVGSPLGWAGTGLTVPFSTISHYRSSSQVVVWIDESLIHQPNGAFSWFANHANFGLDEIIPTAWELMPWSFLIDYFTNIGDIMGSTFDYNRNIAFAKETSMNTSTDFLVCGIPKSSEPMHYVPGVFVPPAYTSQYTVVRRNTRSKLGFPQLDVSLPSLGQTGNIVALLSSLRDNNPFRGHILK